MIPARSRYHLWLLGMREKWRDPPRDHSSWAQYVARDHDGYVRVRTLLSGNVTTWASEIMADDMERDHTYRADYTQRLRDRRD